MQNCAGDEDICVCGNNNYWQKLALSLCLFMAYLPDSFASKELCCLFLPAPLASFPLFHSYADLLEILFQYVLMAFFLPSYVQVLQLTRIPEKVQANDDIVQLFKISRACSHERVVAGFLRQEDILVINTSLLFSSLLVIPKSEE